MLIKRIVLEKNRTGAPPVLFETFAHAVVCKRKNALLHAVALLETVDASAAVDQLLLAGEKRMALRANIDAQLLFDRAGFEGLAAYAANNSLAVVGMDLLFHVCSHLSCTDSQSVQTGLSQALRPRHPMSSCKAHYIISYLPAQLIFVFLQK